jgi:hypothetical protein
MTLLRGVTVLNLLHRLHLLTAFWLGLAWTGVLFGVALAGTEPANADASVHSVTHELVVYVRDGCPHCADAKQFLEQIAHERPHLLVSLRAVDQDPTARDELIALSRRNGVWPPGVPTFSMAGRMLVGFGSSADSGPDLLAWIDQSAAQPPDQVKSRLFGTLSASHLGLPLFTLALGLLDGFNPCAMWVLLFLLSLLVRLQNRRRMAIVAGTFVLVSGAVYYAFMAAWLNIFLAVGLSTPVRWALASLALLIGAVNVKDFMAWGRGFSLSIPESAKPGIYSRVRGVLGAKALPSSLLAVAVLAVVVNFVELLCTAGLPALYTAVLTQQGVSTAAHYAYLGLYILGYLADDTLMVTVAVVALSHRKLTEDTGRWLKLLSGLVMLALGLILLLRPDWLL